MKALPNHTGRRRRVVGRWVIHVTFIKQAAVMRGRATTETENTNISETDSMQNG